MSDLAFKEFFSIHVQDLRNYLHDSKGKFSYLRNREVWPYFLPLFWSKMHVCICLSQYTSFLYDCTLFKYLKSIKDSIDFVKGMVYEENIEFFFFFSLQHHVQKLQRLNFMQFDKILFPTEVKNNLDIDFKGVSIFVLQEAKLIYVTLLFIYRS